MTKITTHLKAFTVQNLYENAAFCHSFSNLHSSAVFFEVQPENNHSQTRAMANQLGRNVLCVEVVYMRLLYSYTCEVKVFYELLLQAFYFFQKKKLKSAHMASL